MTEIVASISTQPSTAGPMTIPRTISSTTAGGHLGCNYQVGQFVLGIEGDLNWADVSGDEALTNQILFLDFFDHGFDWYGTVRGRVGYAVDRWHLFATAGVAFSDIEMTYSFVSIGGDGGGTASCTAPSSDGQAAVIAMAHQRADVDPRSIGSLFELSEVVADTKRAAKNLEGNGIAETRYPPE